MVSRRWVTFLFCWAIGAAGSTLSAQTVQPNPVSWFADFFDPIFGTGRSKGTFTFVDAVTGLPPGGAVLAGSVSPGDTTFIFQVALDADSRRSLTTVGVLGADVTAAGWIPSSIPSSVGFIGAALAFNDEQVVLDGPLSPGRTSDLFFVSFSAVAVGTELTYWVVEEGAGARIFIGTVAVQNENAPEPPREALVLYDDFEVGPLIDPDKWSGAVFGPVLDMRRAQAAGRLLQLNRSYAATDANVGAQFGQTFVGFSNPSAVRAVQATLEVEAVESRGCAGNSAPGRVSAQLFGSFFNSAIRTPNSHVNDVAVSVDVSRASDSTDRRNTLRIDAGVFVCTTPDCSQANLITGASLGTVLRGERVTLKVEWDPQNNRFIVQRDQQPEVSLGYTLPDSSPPGLANKILAVNSTVPNCTAASRPTGQMRLSIDQVLVNASAAR
jgi:hypothetical protein